MKRPDRVYSYEEFVAELRKRGWVATDDGVSNLRLWETPKGRFTVPDWPDGCYPDSILEDLLKLYDEL